MVAFVSAQTTVPSTRHEGDSFRVASEPSCGTRTLRVCGAKRRRSLQAFSTADSHPTTYRVVYDDLTVKDVAPEALPLPVDP